jgi:ABC-type amino acid transport substrate-binding protein
MLLSADFQNNEAVMRTYPTLRHGLGALLLGLSGWACAADQNAPLLDPEEEAYLQAHPELRLCVDPDWMPYERLDADGRHQGLIAEYMALFQQRLGVRFRPVPVDSWNETQARYEAGDCDIVSALNVSAERILYLDFTQPYVESPAVLVVAEGSSAAALEDLGGANLGMVDGYIYADKLRADYPEVRLQHVANMQESLTRVAAGALDATLGPLFLIAYLIQQQGLEGLKMVGNTEYQDQLRVGVRKGDTLLHAILNRQVQALNAEDHARIRRAWLRAGAD